MKKPLLTATLNGTGKTVQVYKHSLSDKYIDFADCQTEYSKEQLKFENQ